MAGTNLVVLCGHLGADPENNMTSKGELALNFNLAINENRTDAEGQRVQHTEWFRIVAYGRVAELAKTYLHKGQEVTVTGRLRSREYTRDEKVTVDGQVITVPMKRIITEIVMNSMDMHSRGKSDQQEG